VSNSAIRILETAGDAKQALNKGQLSSRL